MSDTDPTEEAPIRVGEIVAWRSWYVLRAARGEPYLRSISVKNKIWMPGEPMYGKIHSWGYWSKLQGIYAFETELWGKTFAERISMEYPLIFGRVDLWGRIAVHDRGFRATLAYPLEFLAYVPMSKVHYRTFDQSHSVLEELTKRYIDNAPQERTVEPL